MKKGRENRFLIVAKEITLYEITNYLISKSINTQVSKLGSTSNEKRHVNTDSLCTPLEN